MSLIRNDDNYGLGGSHKVAFNYAMENEFFPIIWREDGQVSNVKKVNHAMVSLVIRE